MTTVVGIDLGTINSCVAIYKDNSVKIINTKDGKKSLRSCVYYGENKKLVIGEEAYSRGVLQPQRAIYDMKRIIGRKFQDEYVQMVLDFWPFHVAQNEANECDIVLPNEKEQLKIKPEEVSAAILNELKENVEQYLNEKIVDAVITVPAYFTDAQKRATKDAAKIAGLNVLRLIPEPTAAALAFLHEENPKNPKTILVYDLGGGTFDVSLLKYNNKEANVLAVTGHYHLGGRDFDRRLLFHVVEEMQERHLSVEVAKARRLKRRLEKKCEEIKIILSSVEIAELTLPEFAEQDFKMTIRRQTFEHINKDFFAKTIAIMDKMLCDAKIDKSKIDEILMIGGSTRIPKINQLVKEYFEGKELNKRVNPDEAVAIGAAIQAAQMSSHPGQEGKHYKLNDVSPHSLGIEVTAENTMNVIISRNTRVPCKIQKNYFTTYDNQEATTIRIFEGESTNVKKNNVLGEFIVDGITPKPKGSVKIQVQFALDENGILKVTATENTKNLSKSLNIKLSNGRMSNTEVETASMRMLKFSSSRVDDD